MTNKAKYFLRIPTSDLEDSHKTLLSDGFSCLYYDSDYLLAWYAIGTQLVSVQENENDSPILVKYVLDSQSEVDILDELGIVANFCADEYGYHFEASFYDPSGTEIRIADLEDLPDSIIDFKEKTCFEFSIPCSNNFLDAVNFWNILGFKVFNDSPKPHTWSCLKDE